MKKIRITVIVAGLLSALASYSQSTNDFGIWSTIELEKDLSKKWALDGELELRTIENSSEINRWGAKLGGSYKIIKGIKAGAAYQFLYFHDLKYSDFQPRHRFIGFVQGKKKWGNVTVSLRERAQVTYKDDSDRIKKSGKVNTYKINPDWTWRNMLKVSYDIPSCRITPALSGETFYQLNNPDGNVFDGLRYVFSLTYKLNKRSAFQLAGILDKEINVDEPTNKHIVSLQYSYEF